MSIDSISDTTTIKGDIVDRFQPEPKISGGNFFNTALQLLGGGLGAVASDGLGLVSSENAALIQLQLQTQKEMMYTSMVSNIEKSRHETQMAPVRNIRVG